MFETVNVGLCVVLKPNDQCQGQGQFFFAKFYGIYCSPYYFVPVFFSRILRDLKFIIMGLKCADLSICVRTRYLFPVFHNEINVLLVQNRQQK